MFLSRAGRTPVWVAAGIRGGNDCNGHRCCECHAAARPRAVRAAHPAAARARGHGRRHRGADRAGGAAALLALVRQRQGRAGPEPRSFRGGAVRPALRQCAQEFAHSRRLDRPVQPADRPGPGLGSEPNRRAMETADPGHRDDVLPVAAVPHRHRVHLPVQPQCRADQCADARRRRAALAHFQYLLDARPGAGDGAAHLPVRLSAGVERAAFGRRLLRGGGADPGRRQAAHRAVDHRAAGGTGDPVGDAARLRQCAGAVRLAGDHRAAGPRLAPGIASGTRVAFVNALALFGSQAIIGLPGRIFTLPTRIYALFDYPPEYGLASALSLVLVLITVVALYLQRAFLARRSYVTLAGKGSRPQLMALGAWRWALLGFVVVIFVVSIVAPYATLIAVSFSKSWGLEFWKGLTLANYKFILFDYNVTQRAILNSLLLATAAASIAVVLGAVIGWIDLRTRIPGRRALDYAALIPLGLPGIVVAVALIQFWLAMPIALYGTLAILLLAYVGRYIPLGVRAANSSLRQIDPSLEESAQILGASWATTMREITLPLIRPGLFAGWLLVFVPVIQELSASILLFSSSSITLAVAVYNLYETGYIEPVAALAMVNMAIIGAAIWLANRLGGGRIASRGEPAPVSA